MIQTGPLPPDQQPTNRRNITVLGALPKEQGVGAPHWAPQPGGPAPGRAAPRMSGFESQWSLCLGELKGYWKQTPLLKGTCKILTCSESVSRQEFERSLGHTLLPILENLLERQEALRLPLGRQTQQTAIWGSYSTAIMPALANTI